MIVLVLILSLALLVCILRMRQLSEQAAEARRSDMKKKIFLHSIANEIREPLRGVNHMANVVADESLYLSKSEKRNISDQLKHTVTLVLTLLDEVMLLNDISEGRQLAAEEFSPNILCRRCLEPLAHLNTKEQLRLTFKRQLSDEFFVHADIHVVELVLNKLIKNACHFTEQGEVTVGCDANATRDVLTFYVQDTGNGIPVDRRESVFTWFDRPEDMRDEAEMDLSIARKLAEKLGGTVRLDAQYTTGTRVLFLLPIR